MYFSFNRESFSKYSFSEIPNKIPYKNLHLIIFYTYKFFDINRFLYNVELFKTFESFLQKIETFSQLEADF